MFDRIYARAQAFELLTGGKAVIDNVEYDYKIKNDEELG